MAIVALKFDNYRLVITNFGIMVFRAIRAVRIAN